MPRRPNPTVGMVECPHCHELAAVRRGADDRFYYQCMCMRQPAFAHDFCLENATLWVDGEPPEAAPDWIRRGLRFKPGARDTGDRPRAPAPEVTVIEDPGPLPVEPVEPATEAGSEPEPVEDQADIEDADDDGRWNFGLFKA